MATKGAAFTGEAGSAFRREGRVDERYSQESPVCGKKGVTTLYDLKRGGNIIDLGAKTPMRKEGRV